MVTGTRCFYTNPECFQLSLPESMLLAGLARGTESAEAPANGGEAISLLQND